MLLIGCIGYTVITTKYTMHTVVSNVNLLYKAEKPSVCPSIRPHFFGRVDLHRGCKDPCQTCSK